MLEELGATVNRWAGRMVKRVEEFDNQAFKPDGRGVGTKLPRGRFGSVAMDRHSRSPPATATDGDADATKTRRRGTSPSKGREPTFSGSVVDDSWENLEPMDGTFAQDSV